MSTDAQIMREALQEARHHSALKHMDLLSEMRCAGCNSARPWLICKLLDRGYRITSLQHDADEDLIGFAVGDDTSDVARFSVEHIDDASDDDAHKIIGALLQIGALEVS